MKEWSSISYTDATAVKIITGSWGGIGTALGRKCPMGNRAV
jgi:hypothetical protein